ncbi:MAG TPA: hypothetical protein VIS74_05280 [Chthoniobacterales bacterium]
MKLASTRLVTNDVPALAQFYSAITGLNPVGIEDYVELDGNLISFFASSAKPTQPIKI